jgi:outer membrane protein TolC
MPKPSPDEHAPVHVLPLSLETIFRLAEEQNPQVRLAREQVSGASADLDLARNSWLPKIYAGPAYYRHEGGIQDFTGNLIHSSYGALFAGVEIRGKMDLRDLVYAKVDAERKIWQQHGELAKLTSENLLDAANTYVDLLAARTAEAIGRNLESRYRQLLEHAEKRAQASELAKEEVHRVQTEIKGQQQLNSKLRDNARSAAAKLNYLLGLDPDTELLVLDRQLMILDLVDLNVPPQVLVDQALTGGPGIREVQGLLAVIEEARQKASGTARFLPTMEVTVAEGAFGAGPGDSMRWDNRVDIALQARWNLTDLVSSKERSAIAQSKMDQVQLTYHDLRGKLALGVHESYEGSVSGREQIAFGTEQVKEATASYDKSFLRLEKQALLKGNVVDVLLSLKSLSAAQYELIRAIRAYDQAQIRLLVVTGMTAPAHLAPAGGIGPGPCTSGQCPAPRATRVTGANGASAVPHGAEQMRTILVINPPSR